MKLKYKHLYAQAKQFDMPFVLALQLRTEYLKKEIEKLETKITNLLEQILLIDCMTETEVLIWDELLETNQTKLVKFETELTELSQIEPFEKIDYQLENDEKVQRARLYPLENIIPSQPKQRGQSRLIYCSPVREDTTPSFVVYLDTNTAYDFGLGTSYDSISLYQAIHNTSFIDTINQLQN